MKKILFTLLLFCVAVIGHSQNYIDGPTGVYGPQWNPFTVISATGNVTVGIGGNWIFAGIVTSRPRTTTNGVLFTGGGTYQDTSATQYINGYASVTGSAAFTLPVGDTAAAPGTQYHTLAISAPSGATTVQAAYLVSGTPNLANLNSIAAVDSFAYWPFSSTASATAAVSITTRDETATFGAAAQVVIAGYRISTSKWESVGIAVTPTGNNQVLTSNSIDLSLYSGFTVAKANTFILVNAKAILQGAWGGSTMSTTLNTLHVIPGTQPYSGAPFSYSGSETTTTAFLNANPTIVDWVLVELRDATTPSIIIKQRAAFISSNGVLLDTNGTAGVKFYSTAAGNYFISIRHRNHLGIRSTAAQAISNSSPLYNFTTAATQANGANAMINVGGVYCMWAGNTEYTANGSGLQIINYGGAVSDVDYTRTAVTSASGNGLHNASFAGASITGVYSIYDCNMDGNIRYSISPSDVDLIRTNLTNVPGNGLHNTSYTQLTEKLP